jgi:glycosyltransferase involved in cell wall biosynthesis
VNKIKTLFVHKFVYNSIFTARVHENHFPKNKSFILYPPIDIENFKPGKKENIILSVARFDSPSHSKRQDILIDAFRILNRSHPEYQLFLAGGVHGESDILDKLKEKVGSLPVKFVVNPNFLKLKDLYAKSKFFWHAAGFEVDELAEPEKVEHFGITTVEAMASGCIPIVIGKGGQKEIITEGTGFLCKDATEIATNTKALIVNNNLYLSTQNATINRSNMYSNSTFFSDQKLISK